MPPHIIKRKDRSSTWYLVDGQVNRSLKTKNRGVAEYLLRDYYRGKYGMNQAVVTVRQFYDRWIETKREPMVRRSLVQDYKQHFSKHILPAFGEVDIRKVTLTELSGFKARLLASGLSAKTVRNIVDATFMAMWRDALAEEIVTNNPFAALRWIRAQRSRPDPFTAQERDKILGHFRETDFFYFPWVFTLFHTGMRPSELSALEWSDIDLEAGRLWITKSRSRGAVASPKTAKSHRQIEVTPGVVQVLRLLPSRALGIKTAFLNKYGDPVDSKKWGEWYLTPALKKLEVRHRKAYSMRHTFITEMVKAGHNLKAIADYCGTSAAMIEENYCGTLVLQINATVLPPSASNYAEKLVAGPGFEPGTSRL